MSYVILAGLALLLAGCAVANRFYVPAALEQVQQEDAEAATKPFPRQVSIVTWNIGYAGMGAESDFVFDLGEQRRPLSPDLVDANLKAIQSRLMQFDADILMLQEVAQPSWSTYGRDVLKGVITALPGYSWFFGADVNTRFVPPPWNVQIGNAIFSRIKDGKAERRGLPLEPDFQLGLFRKGYRMHILRIDAERSWVFVNVHLSTFDSAEDDVRRAQVTALLELAETEYRKGNHVVIGGDWNLRLVDNDFPSNTEERFKFWIRDFPKELVPDGWKWAVDASVPTVRTAYQPYVAGENFVLTIDGFLVSPNVDIVDVAGIDLGFRNTDHHPVTATFRSRP